MSDRSQSGYPHGFTAEVRDAAVPRAPTHASLPAPRKRTARGGEEVREISVRLEVVTPILGGGSETRALDDVDIIRPATVRGHLRFWWRALYAAQEASSSDLYARESRIWGHAAQTDEQKQRGGRSAVEARVEVETPRVGVETDGTIDDSDIRLNDSRSGKATPGAYALWPARAENRTNTPPAPRRRPGIRFRLTLMAPPSCETEVRNALRAWILFGGYGSRTRRGLGSLRVLDDRGTWLPSGATREALTDVFGLDVFAAPQRAPGDVPWLAGAALQVDRPQGDAVQAWTTALDWLKEFRQGTDGSEGSRAREPGAGKPQPKRPSISNWPEADKVRHLAGRTRGHRPRHNDVPAWPRAGFGLPIIGQFQTKARDGGRLDEPGGFELRWRSGDGEHDRLASPLVVKALPLADGTFAPCALWLNRAYPAGEVILRGVRGSQAPFDRLVAPADTPRFSALANKQSLRQAFLDWLQRTHKTTVVAP